MAYRLAHWEDKDKTIEESKNILLEMNLEKETKVLIGLHINMVI